MNTFDMEDYRNRLANNQMLMAMVAKEFIKETSQLVRELAVLVSQANWPKVAAIAHRLKGASAEVSGLSVSECAKEMELAAKKADSSKVHSALSKLQLEYENLLNVLTSKVL